MNRTAEANGPQQQPGSAAPARVYTDYNSVILTLDHMMVRTDQHRVQKFVLSTQSPTESLVSILHYYRDSAMLGRASTLEVLQEGAKSDLSVYCYTGPVNVQLIMSPQSYATFVGHPDWGNGSELVAADKFTQFVAEYQNAQIKVRGGLCPLFNITPTLEPRPSGGAVPQHKPAHRKRT